MDDDEKPGVLRIVRTTREPMTEFDQRRLAGLAVDHRGRTALDNAEAEILAFQGRRGLPGWIFQDDPYMRRVWVCLLSIDDARTDAMYAHAAGVWTASLSGVAVRGQAETPLQAMLAAEAEARRRGWLEGDRADPIAVMQRLKDRLGDAFADIDLAAELAESRMGDDPGVQLRALLSRARDALMRTDIARPEGDAQAVWAELICDIERELT